jgi:nitronate monooxygenase
MNGLIYPEIIQGGMGVNVSDWKLARAVSMLGQQGTLSGVTLEKVMAVILQRGDAGGYLRKALSAFPFPHISKRVLDEFFVEGGVKKGQTLKKAPFFTTSPSSLLISLTVCANYAFVWLAKEGHKNPVSINFLEKIAMPHLFAIFGAMLAGVSFITMGAGIPLQIPEVISSFTVGKEAKYIIPVIGKNVTSFEMSFNPLQFFGVELEKVLPLEKPGFIPIIASNLLATIFVKKLPPGSVYGFVIEEPTAGGHNAPPRKFVLNEKGEPLPIYGEKDRVDYAAIKSLGLPFWIGGSYASPEKLKWAKSVGAKGIQVGTIFALCEESGMGSSLRQRIIDLAKNDELEVNTDMLVSPSGFPFKVVQLKGTISDKVVYGARVRVCNQRALVSLYEREDGTVGYRCASEPVDSYIHKGGVITDTVGKGCLCNGLLSTAGLGDENEPPIVTLGDDTGFLQYVLVSGRNAYSAKDAIAYLLGSV